MKLFRPHDRGRRPHPDVLTPAEWQVLRELREGRTNADIAGRLGLSVNTVRSHVSSMLGKLDLESRAELARWGGEPTEASLVALQRRGVTFGGGPLALLREALGAAAPVAKVAGGVAVAAVAVALVMLAARASQDSEAPQPPAATAKAPTTETEEVATPAPILEWKLGAPIPWPEGVTAVIGTGCSACDGQRSTFALFDPNGRRALPIPDGAQHLAFASGDDRFYLSICTEDCGFFAADPTAPRTALLESIDRGASWRVIDDSQTRSYALGRLRNGEIVIEQDLPRPPTYRSFPSGRPLSPPLASNPRPGWSPFVIDGSAVWLTEDDRLVESSGSVVANLLPLLPAGARARGIVDGPVASYVVGWKSSRRGALAASVSRQATVARFECSRTPSLRSTV